MARDVELARLSKYVVDLLRGRIDGLQVAGWRVSGRFAARGRAALDWTESLTEVARSGAPDESSRR